MAEERRYQVFVSSTISDLVEARRVVSQALLRSGCFPAGMELFPAADRSQFDYIKTVIDDSDYYLIISAGRYGSIEKESGIGFTELEYDYALVTGKPIIRLLHANPFDDLPGGLIEKSAAGRKRLTAFREKLSRAKLVNFWRNSDELLGLTVLSLQQAIADHPCEGWVRGGSDLSHTHARANEALRVQLFDALQRSGDFEALVTTLAPMTAAHFLASYGWPSEPFSYASIAIWLLQILENSLGQGSVPASLELRAVHRYWQKGSDDQTEFVIDLPLLRALVRDGMVEADGEGWRVTDYYRSIGLKLRFLCMTLFGTQVVGKWPK